METVDLRPQTRVIIPTVGSNLHVWQYLQVVFVVVGVWNFIFELFIYKFVSYFAFFQFSHQSVLLVWQWRILTKSGKGWIQNIKDWSAELELSDSILKLVVLLVEGEVRWGLYNAISGDTTVMLISGQTGVRCTPADQSFDQQHSKYIFS